MKPDSDFRPYEILCIEHEEKLLYSEVIQVVPTRKLCWVRPIVLKVEQAIALSLATLADSPNSILYDLRQGSDLLCPSCLFRPVLDTEVISVLAELGESKLRAEVDCAARLELQSFIQQVWQANLEVF
jgi:hypothetical protein